MAKKEEFMCTIHLTLRGKEKERLRYIENIPARDAGYTRSALLRDIIDSGLILSVHLEYSFVQAAGETKESRGSEVDQEKFKFNVSLAMIRSLNKAAKEVYPELSASYGRAKVIRRCISYYYDEKLEEERESQESKQIQEAIKPTNKTIDQLMYPAFLETESGDIEEAIESINKAVLVLDTVKRYFESMPK